MSKKDKDSKFPLITSYAFIRVNADNFGGVGADSSSTLGSDRDNVTVADKPKF